MLMMPYRTAKYGVAVTVAFRLEDNTDSESPFVGAAPLAVDIWLSKDLAAPANATNAMTAIGNGLYSLSLTAAEMQCNLLAITVYDATGTAIFKPVGMDIVTLVQFSQLDIDARQYTPDTDAMLLRGKGTGCGLNAVAGNSTPAYGIRAATGTGGGAGLFADGSNGTNSGGFTAQGAGTAAGATYFGGSSGEGFAATGQAGAVGAHFKGGTTGGDGLKVEGRGANACGLISIGGGDGGHGASFQATGSGAHGVQMIADNDADGLHLLGGGVGMGLNCIGGDDGGHGIVAGAVPGGGVGIVAEGAAGEVGISVIGGANADALICQGTGTGAGIVAQGGLTSGPGARIKALGGNQVGLYCEGHGTEAGIQGHGGGTGYGIQASSNGGGTKLNNFFERLENATTDPAYVPGSNTMEHLLMLLVRRWYGHHTAIKTSPGIGVITVYGRDDVTVLGEGPILEPDADTQEIGPLG